MGYLCNRYQAIDHLFTIMIKKELQQTRDTWEQVHLSTVIFKRNTVKGLNIPKYDPKGVKGKICIIREVVILPFITTVVKAIVNLMTDSKCVNVVVEPVMGYLDHIAMVRLYGVFKPGRDKIDVCPRNHSPKQIIIPKQTAVGEIAAANVILLLLAPKPTEDESCKGETITQKRKYGIQKEMLDKTDLTGLSD